jgi:uncharacterized protein (DUF2336 family)
MEQQDNVGLDISVLEAVLDSGTVEARIALLRQLAAMVAAEDTPKIELDQIVPILLKLVVDPVRKVREALIEELALLPNLHPDLLFSLIASDDDLAIPFLSSTPSLGGWHMMAILRVGDERRQCTIAGRADITAEAATFIIKSGALAPVLALMDNAVVRLEPSDMQLLYTRLGNSGAIIERLLALPNLPLDVRIMQAKKAASRMRQLMAERGWIAANDASELVADAEESAILQVLSEAALKELVDAVSFLAAKQMLTPSIIVRAACLGEQRVVEATLAHLSGFSPQKVANLLYARGGNGVRTVVSKSGIPNSCSGIVAAFAEVAMEAREEGIELSPESFGRRLLEALMTRYENLSNLDRSKQIDFIARLGNEKVRKIARQLKVDIQRAA